MPDTEANRPEVKDFKKFELFEGGDPDSNKKRAAEKKAAAKAAETEARAEVKSADDGKRATR